MAQEPTIVQILNTANMRQPLAFNLVAKQQAFKGGSLNPFWPIQIELLRGTIQHRYDLNPADSALTGNGNQLFNIVAPLLTANTNLLTSNLSIVSVTTTEIDLVWNAVPNGITYVLERALDSGFTSGLTTIYSGGALLFNDTGRTPATHYFYRIHVEAPGFTNSPYSYADATTLSVPVLITISYYFGDTDFYSTLQAGTDAVPYVGSQNITHNLPFTITWPAGAANNKFQVIRVPIGESIKTAFFNTPLNQGAIPGPEYQSPLQPVLLPLYTYYCSRTAISLDGSTLTETFS